MKLNNIELTLLANDIHQYFNRLDHPPADEIKVPLNQIESSWKDDSYVALVRFIVNFCGIKTHTVRIKLNVDNKGRFITSNWHYI